MQTTVAALSLPDTELVRRAVADPPHWAGRKILPWDEDAFRAVEPFVVEKYWSGQHSINVFEVVGTQHPDYQGMTWLEFLQQGKRMRQNLALQESNPDYYLEDAVKLPTMYYVAIDGSGWYVAGDGNHRTCIARFMFHRMGRTMLHGVNVESYRTDRHAAEVFRALREMITRKGLPLLAEPYREKLSRDDTGGWMRETYRVGILLRDLAKGTEEVLAPMEAERKLDGIKRENRLRRWWRRIVG
ncbi:hypothetical protein [Pelomicrobium methylotrophicum]|uniref:Uncharacterized protein n=1 Tax=Pelomicrobium methylotrophicum TaxID=2602750 RepID=A0A5C7EVV7_9PROT|nr:hypothetical protein [Pelomicrobium methylotrophicum]TXF11205.1 hypothetical protein FR698_11890 [Pelomicrobium methylotrophicum]